MLTVPRAASLLMAAVLLAGCHYQVPQKYALKSHAEWSDGKEIFGLLLSEPRFKEVADRVSPFIVSVNVQHPSYADRFDYAYKEGNVSYAARGKADFTLTISRDVALAVLNADDGFRVFACAMKANAATFEANNMVHAASFNGAKGRIFESATDCAAKVGDAVTFRGLSGQLLDGDELNANAVSNVGIPGGLPPLVARLNGDLLAFNDWRAPTRWISSTYGIYCMGANSTDICAGAGTSVRTSDLADCAAKVKAAYADEPPAEGWSAGQAAARAANKAAEEALCQLVFGGV